MPYLALQTERTCDFSYGGLLMWAPYFDYEYAIEADTLFIKGRDDVGQESFIVPLGNLPIAESIEMLGQYCKSRGIPLRLSAMPGGIAGVISEMYGLPLVQQPAIADYLYPAQALATLAGRKLSKKRNHVNRFMAEYAGRHVYEPLHHSHVPEIRRRMMHAIEREAGQSEQAAQERRLAGCFLQEFEDGNPYMLGGVLKVDGRIVACTIGEVKGDTLYVHIEKAERKVAGCHETINTMFVRAMLDACPSLRYVNREDDAGDPGLRASKQSYHPLTLLQKYTITIPY